MKHIAHLVLPLVFALLMNGGAAAQHEHDHEHEQGPTHSTKDTKWKMMGEIGIGPTTDKLVAQAIEYMRGFIAAGVEDGEHERWAQRAFMTEETLTAVPLRFRFLRPATESGRMRMAPLLLLDYSKEIDFTKVFETMRVIPLEGDALSVSGMHICPVKRPDGGFRLNFSDDDRFGPKPTENPLLTKFLEIEAKARNEKLMARLRQLPIHGSFDFRQVLSDRENKEFAKIFGPRAGLVAGALSTMGRRLAVDLYSSMRPGEGVVGQYLEARQGHARLLGSLNFAPGVILATDLGERTNLKLLTLIKASIHARDKKILDPLLDALESWNGEINVIATGDDAPEDLSDVAPEVFESFGKSLEGTILFGVEEDSAADVTKILETFLSSESAQNSEFEFRIEKDDAGRTFRVGGRPAKDLGVKYIAVGAGKRFVVMSIANSRKTCLERKDGALAAQSSIPMPKKFGLAQGPVKLWAHQKTLRYAAAFYRTMSHSMFRSSQANRGDWVQDRIEKELLTENVAVTLSWTKRFGVMLRVLF